MGPDLLTVIVASVFFLVFCLVILMVVLVIYRQDPLCCRLRPCRTQEYTEDLPHYHSRHSLINITHNGHTAAMNQTAIGPQLPGRLFIIGKPNDYHMDGPLPRLPSYESIRKKDRQRQIHSMIAQRFGLTSHDEPPPTYEETFCQSIGISPTDEQSLDVHLPIHTWNDSSNLSEDTCSCCQPYTRLQQPAST